MCYDPNSAKMLWSLSTEAGKCGSFCISHVKKRSFPLSSNSDIWGRFFTFQGCQFRILWLTVGESLGHLICFICFTLFCCHWYHWCLLIEILCGWKMQKKKQTSKHIRSIHMWVFSKEPFHEFMDSLRHAYDVNVVKPHLFICAFSLFQGAVEFWRFLSDRKPPVVRGQLLDG